MNFSKKFIHFYLLMIGLFAVFSMTNAELNIVRTPTRMTTPKPQQECGIGQKWVATLNRCMKTASK